MPSPKRLIATPQDLFSAMFKLSRDMANLYRGDKNDPEARDANAMAWMADSFRPSLVIHVLKNPDLPLPKRYATGPNFLTYVRGVWSIANDKNEVAAARLRAMESLKDIMQAMAASHPQVHQQIDQLNHTRESGRGRLSDTPRPGRANVVLPFAVTAG